MPISSPFSASSSKPGHGRITVELLPPCSPVLREVSYQYPLKLVAPDPIPPPNYVEPNHDGDKGSDEGEINGTKTQGPKSNGNGKDNASHDPFPPPLVHTIFLLTYGGGIVAGDSIDLHISLAPGTRLNLLTQGSTKVFKTPDPQIVSTQRMTIDLWPGAALCYLPDPVQPFKNSAFVQRVEVNFIRPGDDEGGKANTGGAGVDGHNICICDWVTGGRAARGENWDFYKYESRNEVYASSTPTRTPPHRNESSSGKKKKRLLLRDNLLLHDPPSSGFFPPPPPPTAAAHHSSLSNASNPSTPVFSVFGTLILYGPLFSPLSTHFMTEFSHLPRLGGKNWDHHPSSSSSSSSPVPASLSAAEKSRRARHVKEKRDGLIWSAARVRDGFTLVKFAAREVEGARSWLRDMVGGDLGRVGMGMDDGGTSGGSVKGAFGERAGMCLK